jgi:ribosome recycling factor
MVDYYGQQTPLNQLAVISAPEPTLLTVRPYDPESLEEIERAILKSDVGLTPNNDGRIIRLPIPRLSEERRQDLVKMVGQRVEEGKVALRNIRRDALDDLRDFEGEGLISEDAFYRAKEDLQDLTNRPLINKIVNNIPRWNMCLSMLALLWMATGVGRGIAGYLDWPGTARARRICGVSSELLSSLALTF